jgi:hypothetical protein
MVKLNDILVSILAGRLQAMDEKASGIVLVARQGLKNKCRDK